MRTVRCFVAAGFLFFIAAALGQNPPPECNDSMCLTLREVFAAGPGGFQSLRGNQIEAESQSAARYGLYDFLSKVQLPGFNGGKYDRCYIQASGGFRCIKGFDDRSAADHFAETIVNGITQAERNWKVNRLYFSDKRMLQFTFAGLCSAGEPAIFVARGAGLSKTERTTKPARHKSCGLL